MIDVLIVDDDESFLRTSTKMLDLDGYAAAGAPSLEAAIVAVRNRLPHAMIVDWKLPDGSGLELLRWMGARSLRVPAAVVTGFWIDPEFDSMMAEAKRLGVVTCVRRGIDFAEPSAVVRRLLNPFADLQACNSITEQLLSSIVPKLRSRFRFLSDKDLVVDAVTDTIVHLLQNPAAFDPVRHISLERYTWIVARRKLSNAIRSDRRSRSREREYAALHTSEITPDEPFEQSEGRRIMTEALAREPEIECRRALQGWLEGNHDLAPWMAVPSIQALPRPDVTHEVKRRKDALVARVKRLVKASIKKRYS